MMNPRTSLSLELLQQFLALKLVGKCLEKNWEQVSEWESENESVRGEELSQPPFVFIE